MLLHTVPHGKCSLCGMMRLITIPSACRRDLPHAFNYVLFFLARKLGLCLFFYCPWQRCLCTKRCKRKFRIPFVSHLYFMQQRYLTGRVQTFETRLRTYIIIHLLSILHFELPLLFSLRSYEVWCGPGTDRADLGRLSMPHVLTSPYATYRLVSDTYSLFY